MALKTLSSRIDGVDLAVAPKLATLGIALALVSISCSENTVVDGADRRVNEIPSAIPPEQRDAYDDGTVDTKEYHAAFGLFRACANADETLVGFIQTDPMSGAIDYGVRGTVSAPGPSNGTAVDDCYQRYFSWIEATWQTTDPGALELVTQQSREFLEDVMRPCLESNGVVIPAEVVPGTDAYGDLAWQFASLHASSKCTT